MAHAVPRGLYAITEPALIPAEQLVARVAKAIQGGAVMVQYRDKGDDAERRLWEVQDLVNLCRPLRVPLIVNDDVELAAKGGADGVHLGQGDAPLSAARERLGPEAIIGITCHNQLELAEAAAAAGADYVAFGAFFPSPVKPEAVKAEPELIRQAKQRLDIPVVAIGGITAENGAQLVAAGVDLLAVITDVFGQNDIVGAARQISNLFTD